MREHPNGCCVGWFGEQRLRSCQEGPLIQGRRLGRQRTITDATGSRSFAYNDALQLAAETNTFGVLVRAYDGLGRSAGFSLFNPANPVNPVQSIIYGYDSLGRFHSVSSSVFSALSVAKYSYLPGTDILSGWSSPSGFAVTRAFEPHRDLLTAVSNRYNGDTVSAFDYVNDALARRTARIDHSGAGVPPAITNAFGYNPRSELTSAAMGTNAYGYAFDPIGNREWTRMNANTNIYQANALNQYTNILCASAPPRENIPLYDHDGNMTFLPSTSGGGADGWHLRWNGENRLIQASNALHLVTYAYDYQGRMVTKQFSRRGAEAQSWEIEKTNSLIWDGFNIVQSLTHTQTHTLTNSFIWGLDLSGSLHGAGGVGGLLAEIQDGAPYFAAFDANGNVTEYLSTNGLIAAHYEYSPFGEITAQSGDQSDAFTHRFSTKPWCAVTGLSEYEMRMYGPGLGRWLSRDPIGEIDSGQVSKARPL
ncbi:MAG: hypothetical protein FJ222_11525 [Lentisphaerae bacterium]|nr:hypothetical protein [Lentisphaerota bacterium]